MTTVINTPGNGSGEGSSMGVIIGVIIAILVIVLFFVYGWPALRGRPAAPAQNGLNVNVGLPGGNSGSSGAAQ